MFNDQVSVQATIEASPEDVFNFLVNPYQIPLVLPGLIENADIPQLPLKVGDTFTYRYQVAGVVLEGKWTVTGLDSPTSYTARTSGGADSEWTYEISGHEGHTHVSLTVAYDLPESLASKAPASVLNRIGVHEGQSLMDNLKVVLEVKDS